MPLQIPKLFKFRTDAFERAHITSNRYYDWLIENPCLAFAGNFLISQFLKTFREFPPGAGGNVPDGLGRSLSRGGARSHRDRQRLLDRPLSGH